MEVSIHDKSQCVYFHGQGVIQRTFRRFAFLKTNKLLAGMAGP